MRVVDYMRDSLILLDMDALSKKEAITKTVNKMKESGAISNAGKFLEAVFERESLGSTAIGRGMALPHARTQHIENITIAMVRLKNGIDFDAADGQTVNLLFLLGTPLKTVGEYLSVLAKLSKILKNDKTRDKLLKAKSPSEVRTLLAEAES
ncbi:PTS sugar transporter subunit IIA [candidate division KSB1 bacterium]|nr:PTS sugar transporter subunit IIA [candidate division KSB1 bacterium]RQW00313.1 MAG: PTS sugar transporter subunit IIA [candidate division KSB1 bacterium]